MLLVLFLGLVLEFDSRALIEDEPEDEDEDDSEDGTFGRDPLRLGIPASSRRRLRRFRDS
jgi:hypothetical protein